MATVRILDVMSEKFKLECITK